MLSTSHQTYCVITQKVLKDKKLAISSPVSPLNVLYNKGYVHHRLKSRLSCNLTYEEWSTCIILCVSFTFQWIPTVHHLFMHRQSSSCYSTCSCCFECDRIYFILFQTSNVTVRRSLKTVQYKDWIRPKNTCTIFTKEAQIFFFCFIFIM